MFTCPRPLVLFFLLAGLTAGLTAGLARAQAEHLLPLAPPSASVLLLLDTSADRLPRFLTDLDSLEALESAATVSELLAILSPGGAPGPTALLGTLGATPAESLAATLCPALRRPLRALAPGGDLPPFQALLALELAGEEPIVTILVDFPSATRATTRMLEMALAGCARNAVETAAEGPSKMYIFGDEWSPLAVLFLADGSIAISTEPAAVSALLDRSLGVPEPPLRTEPLQRFEGDAPFLRLLLRPPSLISPLLSTGAFPTVSEPLIRLSDALQTIELVALQWSADERGLLTESLAALDPDGPDTRLRSLLLCHECAAAQLPHLAPASSYLSATGRWPAQEAFEYLGWLLGEDGEWLQERVLEATGIDLAGDLFSWLGEEFQLAQLSPHAADLPSLLYGPGTVLMLEVEDEATAEAALQRLTGRLQEVLAEGGFEGALPLAIRDADYRGVHVHRLQLSATVDLGYALLDERLLLASPSAALRPVIDTYHGSPAISGSEAFMQAVAGVPEDALSISYQQTAAQLSAITEVLAAVAQPVAFLLEQIVRAELEGAAGRSGAGWTIAMADFETTPLESGSLSEQLGGGTPAEAGAADQEVGDKLSHLYSIPSPSPLHGQRVTVVLESQDFDTMLYLIDVASGTVLALNDDAPDTTRSELTFLVDEEREYLLQVTSFGGDEEGGYRLSVELLPASVATTTAPPSFEQLLELAELPARTAELLARHLVTTVGYATVDGDVLYARSLTAPAR